MVMRMLIRDALKFLIFEQVSASVTLTLNLDVVDVGNRVTVVFPL